MHIPSFRWANGTEVWNCMLEKDASYSKLRSERLLERHPSLVHSYRTILFDWLSEVSHECKFHRETYHLALDFIDRYLAATSHVGKYQLQLIGTTCLFLAAKYEEIRPPTVIEFAELTDGACKAEDIVDNEVVILSALGWEITPMTPNNWLNIYMQMLHSPDQVDLGADQSAGTPTADSQTSDKSRVPLARKCLHKRIASVIDLAILHMDSLKFRNSILAAAAIRHFSPAATTEPLLRGSSARELAECQRWLEPFVAIVRQSVDDSILEDSCQGTHPTQMHTHIATATMLEQVLELMGAQKSAEAAAAASAASNLKRKAYCLDEDLEETAAAAEVARSRDHQDAQVTSTTVLLTPPSSTSKARKQIKRHHHAPSAATIAGVANRYQGASECSPPPPPRQPLQLQQNQPLPIAPLQTAREQQQQPKGSLHAQCRGEKVGA